MINKLGLLLLIIGIFLILLSFSKNLQLSSLPVVTPSSSITSLATITKVVDGDTVDVEINGKADIIRLIGINSPEVGKCFGKEAAIEVRNILQSKSVILEADPSQDNRDVYNRLLRYIFLPDGKNFGELMIKNGFAKEYTFKTTYKYQFLYKQAQQLAEESNNGLWADNACLKPKSEDGSEGREDR